MEVQVYPNLVELPNPYRHLMNQDCYRSIFITGPWYENFIRNGLGRDEAKVFAVDDGGRAAGVLIGVQPPQSIRSLGAKVVRFTHPDQVDFCAYVRGGCASPAVVIEQVVSALGRKGWNYDVVNFEGLDPDSSLYENLQRALGKHGFFCQKYLFCTNWYEDLSDLSFEQYLAKRPSRLLNTLRRRERRLEKEAVGQFQLVIGGQQMATAFADYVRITVASWQGRHPMASEYLQGLLNLASSLGALRLGILYVDGRPAAGQIWFVSSDTAACYRLAYDRRFERFSAGSLVTREMIRHVIDVDRVSRLDFGTGDEAYKKDWVGSRRELWGLAGYRKGTCSGLGNATWQMGILSLKAILGRSATISRSP